MTPQSQTEFRWANDAANPLLLLPHSGLVIAQHTAPWLGTHYKRIASHCMPSLHHSMHWHDLLLQTDSFATVLSPLVAIALAMPTRCILIVHA